MPGTVQEFLAETTQKAAANLETAFLRIPEDKRSWSPMDKARSAGDQAAECAILAGYTASMIKAKAWSDSDFAAYGEEHARLSQDWNAIKALLDENLPKIKEAILAVPDADFAIEIKMPWTTMTLEEVLAYPSWNMSYHEGQINLLHQLIEGLDEGVQWNSGAVKTDAAPWRNTSTV